MGINLDDLELLDPAETEKAKAERERKRVEDLLPVAEKIKAAEDRVRFKLDTEGANAELERLRTAARIQGFSLRILDRETDGKVTMVTVKPTKLIERRTAEEIAAEKAAEAESEKNAEAEPEKATPKPAAHAKAAK